MIQAARLAAGPERFAALHRYRFVVPLCRGKVVADAGPPDPEGQALLAAAARRLVTGPAAAEVVVWLAPLRGGEVAAALPALRRQLAAGGILVVAVGDAVGLARATLGAAFRHLAAYWQRPLAGTLIAEEAFARARVVALADPAPDGPPPATLLIATDTPLPPVASGLFTAAAALPRPTGTATDHEMIARPHADPSPAATAPPMPPETDLRRRAVSLVDRAVELDDRAIGLAAETARLRQQLERLQAAGGAAVTGWFEPPRTAHVWPLAEAPGREPADLTLYEHRPDDAVLAAARAGETFLKRFALLTERPDLPGAVAALNAAPPRLGPPADGAAPDASIIIPVHGQLAYTLNCLESLLGHAAGLSAEIVVVDDASPDATAEVLEGVRGIMLWRNRTNLGFLRSCNAAAAAARGKLIVLLNNDTRVLPGWLDALAESFRSFPRAGLVGSKLLYPDALLQEAGAIIWRDGSAWNYGRNDDPNRPQYCHARQADYVSAASIAVPAAMWRDLGGFDERYAPAYCEDSDFALRVRAAGREVWYQPLSKALHYEGRTSGTDTSAGVKAHQVVNGARLFLRWREDLARYRPNGEAPYFERERGVAKRALVIDAVTPTPKQDAGSVTTTLTLRLFAELGYKPYFAPQDNMLFEPANTPPLQALGVECAYAPYELSFDEFIRRYGALFDAVLVYRVPVLEQVMEGLRRYAPRAPVLFHTMDLHFLRLQRQAALDGSEATALAAAQMKAKELGLIRRVDCTITHSVFERDLLAAEAPEAPCVVWPFMFDFFGTAAGFAARRDFVFLGGYRHAPNVDAVRFFATEVLPLIRAREPQARFIIAGANPGPEVQALAGPQVVVTGMVEDLRDVLDAARVFVCPLRFGAGTKGKISTAMSYGLPVVTTTCGAEGMELVEGKDVLVADDPAALAAACLRVYRDRALWRRLSAAGQQLVREKHSPEAGRGILAAALETALRHKLGVET
jgi:GT2 family glycosyltransferase